MNIRFAPLGAGVLCAGLLFSPLLPAAGPGPTPEVLTTANYVFATTTTGSLADLTTGSTQLIGPAQLDYASPLTPIGFDFYLRGIRHTQFSVNANGLIQLGSIAQTGSPYRPLAQTNKPLLTPYGASMRLHSTGKVHYKILGSAPVRTLVVEWRNVQSLPFEGGDPDLTFQAQLNEGTGVIRYVYGSMTLNPFVAAVPDTASPHIGFSTSDLAGTVGSVAAPQSGSPAPSYNGSSASPQSNNYVAGPLTALTSAADGSRRTLTFTPPVPTPPTNLSFSAVQLAGMTLTWTDAPNEQGYALYASTDGVNFSYFDAVGENVTSYVATDLVTTTTYHWRVYSISEGALSATPLSGSQATLTGAFSGTYTVGPTGNYASIGAAFAAFNTGGTTGPVNVELQPAYLGTAETYPLAIPRIPGATPATPVTVRPAAGASGLSLSSAAAVTLDLNNCRSVVFDGRPGGAGTTSQLTVANTSTSGVAVRFINDASRNVLRYLTAAGVNNTAAGGVVLFSTTTGTTGNDDNLIDACVVRDGATTPTNGLTSIGTTTTQAHFNSGNVVQNSSILNFFAAGAASRGIHLSSGSTDWTIQGNSLYQTAPRVGTVGITHIGINVENTSGHGFTVANNVIGGSAPNAGGAPWTLGPVSVAVRYRGISIASGFDRITSVQGNTLTNFAFSSSSTQTPVNGGPFCGLYLTGGKLSVGTIAGNTIGAATGTGAITLTANFSGGTSVGILANSNGVQPTIANNTVGSITLAGSSNGISASFQGITLAAASISGTNLVVGNTIGSATTANSIQAVTPSTDSLVQSLVGISLTAGANVSLVGNTIANLQNNYSPAAAASTRIVSGIVNTNSVVSIVGNTIRNLGTGANATGAGSTASVVGILQSATAAPSTISQNLVHSLANTHPSAATSVVGIHQTGHASEVSNVTRNFVHSLSLGTSAVAGSILGMASGSGLSSFQNNFVALGLDAAGNSLTSGYNIQGLQYGAGQNSYYHNSVSIGGTGVGGSGSTYAFNSDVPTVLRDIRNNSFTNARSNAGGTGSHYAVQVGGSGTNPAGLTMDFNLFFVSGTGGVFGRYNGAPVASLTDWKTATGVDLSSLFANPNYLQTGGGAATVDLHIQPSGSPVEGNGTPISGVTIDYDGQSRSALTPTDIGADAGNFVGGDLQPPLFAFTPLTDTTTTTARTLRAFIFDAVSGVPFSGIGLPRLHWRTESTGYSVVTAVPQGGGFYEFTFGGGAPLGSKVFYYLTAQDLAAPANVTALPLAGSGGFTASPPTAATPPTTPYSYSVRHPVSGSLTVGSGGSFGSLAAAVDHVNRGILTGPTTLLLTDATYPVLTQPITIRSNPGSSATNTLTIKPQSGVSATLESNGCPVLRVIGADYLVVESENGAGPINHTMRFAAVNSTSIISVENLIAAGLLDPATHNIFRNLDLFGSNSTEYGIFCGGETLGSLGRGNHANWYVDNTVAGVEVGICTLGFSADDKNIGTRIEGNQIATAGNPNARIGIQAGFEDRLVINFNRIGNLVQSSGTQDSIGIALGSDNFFTSGFGFPGQQCSNVLVQGNRIGTVSHSANRSAIGIAVAPSGPGTTDLINNAIHSVLSNGTGTEVCAGIFLVGQNAAGSTTQLLGNSVSLTGSMTGGTVPVCGLQLGTGPITFLRNNTVEVLATNGSTGPGAGSIAIASDTTPPSNLDSNRNNFYVVAGPSAYVGRLGVVNQPTLANWQTATGGDVRSISAAPQHTSTADLTPLPGSPLLGAGTALPGLVADLLGIVRPTPPAIGAHEPAQASGLSDLRFTPGDLVPAFETGRLGYDIHLPTGATTATVTPTAAVPGTTITVKVNSGPAVPVTSGSASPPLALTVGHNKIELQLTPPSGPPPPPTVVNCEREGQLVAGDVEVQATLNTPLAILIDEILAAAGVGPGVGAVSVTAEGTSAQGGEVTNTEDEIIYQPPSDYVGQDQVSFILGGENGEVSNGKIKVSIEFPLAYAGMVTLAGSDVRIDIYGVIGLEGHHFRVDYTDDLTQPFQPLEKDGQPILLFPDKKGGFGFVDPNAPDGGHRFYRIVAVKSQ